ncbi:MAG: nitroreductase family protein [Burkholderiales bacterium]|nr:nitroreductase family protein [Burkholderiales bacterium]
MNTLTKMALGLIGQLHTQPASGESLTMMALPPAQTTGGLPLMEALRQRHSAREFRPDALTQQQLSDLLWAACGLNRETLGGRTAPSAMNAQEVDLYVALPQGLYLYEPKAHALQLVVPEDVRRVTGYQDFVDTAPLDLIFVADHSRMKIVPAAMRESYASVAAGAMAQNIYLYCASVGLSTVVRAWFDRQALTQAMGLTPDQQLLLTQTVGLPLGHEGSS